MEDNDPYSILSIFEIERITENTIEELPDQCKSIFKLSRINGLKNQEIADKLVSPSVQWKHRYIEPLRF